MELDRGYLSPQFVTDVETVNCILESPYILICEQKLSEDIDGLVAVLQKVVKAGKPLLVIAENVEDAALATLVVNKLREVLVSCAIKAPGFGDRRKRMLEDIAVLTGGRAILSDLGIDLANLTLDDLGRAERVIIGKGSTILVDGAGDSKAVGARIEQIREQMDATTSDYDREKLDERLSKLKAGVARIMVTGKNEDERQERIRLVRDALKATRLAGQEGALPGGGVALLRARGALGYVQAEGDEALGIEIVERVLPAPLRTLVENTGIDAEPVVSEVEKRGGSIGFDVVNEAYVDMHKAGILDPLRAVSEALSNAAALARLLMEHETLEHEQRTVQEPSPVQAGVVKLRNAVCRTMGPCARPVVLPRETVPVVTKRSAALLEALALTDKDENAAADLVRKAALGTHEAVGDGAARTVVLAADMLLASARSLPKSGNPAAIKRGIARAVKAAVASIEGMTESVSGAEQIAHVAAIAGDGDPDVGKIIADAMGKVGKDGVICIEQGEGLEPGLEVVEGLCLDSGYASVYFSTDADKQIAILEDAVVLIHDGEIGSAQEVIGFLEKAQATGKPLLVIAHDFAEEALATLVVNKVKGVLEVCAVRAPHEGEHRRAVLEDLAILTGAQMVKGDRDTDLTSVTAEEFGRARKVVVDQDTTTIVETGGKRAHIAGRVNQIRHEIEVATSDKKSERLQERLAKLAGGVAVIRAGGLTHHEMQERVSIFEHALKSTRTAVEHGSVPGGGIPLLRARAALQGLAATGDEALGIDAVSAALAQPLSAMLTNAGIDAADVLGKVEAGERAFGYDVKRGQYGDMVRAGVIDPAKVLCTALSKAGEVANLLIDHEARIAKSRDFSGRA